MAMVYAQSTSEMQTIISMPLELEYNAHQRGVQMLDDPGSAGGGGTLQFRQMDSSVMCNYSPDPGINGAKGYVLSEGIQQNGLLDSPEDLSCIPLSLPDMPAQLSNGYSEPIAMVDRPVAMGSRSVLDESPEQSVIEDSCLDQQSCEADMSLKGLSWQPFMVDSWFRMCDSRLLDINHEEVANGMTVEADKGFNFSPWDESFVCQKKNHFQISVQLKLQKIPKYIKTEHHEIEHIRNFALHLYGIKFEAPGSVIHIEQSKTDRSKLPYEPIVLEFPTVPDQLVKATACRLHFSETTANNMRKRGKPNPDQKYFALVVALHAYTVTCDYPVVAYVSERIIVRASNPGQFDNEGDSIWAKSNSGESAFYHGKVGINTESPEESLTVVGNVSVTGNILHPSDKRLKQDIKRMDTRDMLDNVLRMTLYSYSFKKSAFGENAGAVCNKRNEVGLIAQEVQAIVPDAVQEMDFQGTNDVRMINKDRILMELLGAVQELCREKRDHFSPAPALSISLIMLTLLMALLLSFLL